MAAQNPNTSQFEAYFQRADVDRDGRISGNEAVAFLQASNLPRQVLAQIWMYADQNRVGFLGRSEFYNFLKLVTVAQSKRELTPDLVKAALYGPASAKIPPPQINLSATTSPQSNTESGTSPVQSGGPSTSTGIGVNSPHGFLSQQSQMTRPLQPLPPSSGFESQPAVPTQGIPTTSSMSVSRPPNSLDSFGGSTDGSQARFSSQVPNRGLTPSATQGEISLIASPTTQTKAPETTGLLHSALSQPNATALVSSQVGKEDSKSFSAPGNGFSSDSVFGDVISTTQSKPQNNPAAHAYGAGSDQPIMKQSTISQPSAIQAQQFQSTGKANQHIPAHESSEFPVAAGQSQSPWPKMTQSDVQKYRKVFVQVDTDRDGRITGEQARNLFLSWRLPREVLKQVWDLSDQDNDSMLSLSEFCIALYLMERYREGRPLPKSLPNFAMFDETLVPTSGSGPRAAVHGNPSLRPSGYQQPQGANNARSITSSGVGRPPRPVPVLQPDEPIQQKAKVPVLEKHLLEQLSTEEQGSLNRKSEEAKDAEKKVADLEKDISEAKQKIQFYHAKMQELILYKSRCDNRLNEISEKVIGDKREAESLANKYEEKYKQTGDVASKLTIEEATFRDIQERKMKLYRAIIKLEQDNADGVQDRANQIQSDLEELVKDLNEQCKTYGLRGKPTSLVELPFGWQPGIGATAADWDEVWDKFEDDEGFAYVKEFTLEVQNVIAPPRPKSALIRQHATSSNLSKPDNTSELPNSGERAHEKEKQDLPDSPGNKSVESPREIQNFRTKDTNLNGSPHAFDTQSEYGTETGEKRFDESQWGSFDTHYDSVSDWDFNPADLKEGENERNIKDPLFSPDDWGLNPIRTGPKPTDTTTPNQGPFFDSVPSTPNQGPFFDSVPSTPQYNFSSSPFAFADSVPSTPLYSSNTSPRGLNEDPYTLSRFDSFNLQDSGPFGTLTRFDSMQSTRESSDFDQDFGSLARFDSFRSTADSDYNFGQPHPRDSFSRFDSMRSTRDSEYGQGFSSFDDGVDPFGSSEPFRSSSTPKKDDSDSWKAF